MRTSQAILGHIGSRLERDVGVKQSKLQQVHTKFEELQIREYKKIIQFNAQIQELKKLFCRKYF